MSIGSIEDSQVIGLIDLDGNQVMVDTSNNDHIIEEVRNWAGDDVARLVEVRFKAIEEECEEKYRIKFEDWKESYEADMEIELEDVAELKSICRNLESENEELEKELEVYKKELDKVNEANRVLLDKLRESRDVMKQQGFDKMRKGKKKVIRRKVK